MSNLRVTDNKIAHDTITIIIIDIMYKYNAHTLGIISIYIFKSWFHTEFAREYVKEKFAFKRLAIVNNTFWNLSQWK